MPCGDCVDRLARKLVEHHKIDLIRAYELAEKGIERFERQKPQETIIFSGGSDYSQTCNNCGKYCDCYKVETCTLSTQCQEVETCSGLSCCPNPLAHSHQVSNGCTDVTPAYRCSCRTGVCGGSCDCSPHGVCTYDCDVGYVWNPATLQCELPVSKVLRRLLVGVGL